MNRHRSTKKSIVFIFAGVGKQTHAVFPWSKYDDQAAQAGNCQGIFFA
jgi:hypothetical protein